jgi:hypothetical protein
MIISQNLLQTVVQLTTVECSGFEVRLKFCIRETARHQRDGRMHDNDHHRQLVTICGG